MKHTSGTWEVKIWADSTIDVILPISEKRFNNICQVTSSDVYGQTEANAKLISAAPEMLLALQVALPYLKATGTNGNHFVEKIEEVIKKAVG